MGVEVDSEAEEQLRSLPTGERDAMDNAFEQLEVLGDQLPFPHSSGVKGTAHIRELRPRAGRSRWRAFYRRVGDVIVIGATGPEATVSPQGFERAVRLAERRLAGREQERDRGRADSS